MKSCKKYVQFVKINSVKTYLRATTTDTRMNNLMVLHVHNSDTDKLDFQKAAKSVERRESRKTIFGTFTTK